MKSLGAADISVSSKTHSAFVNMDSLQIWSVLVHYFANAVKSAVRVKCTGNFINFLYFVISVTSSPDVDVLVMRFIRCSCASSSISMPASAILSVIALLKAGAGFTTFSRIISRA